VAPASGNRVPTGEAHRLGGTWRNELGSELTLTEEAGGTLAGSYRSGVGGTLALRHVTGTSVRHADGSAVVGFVVSWPSTDSLAVWIGRYEPGADQIVTTWLLEAGSTEATAWRATLHGGDVFCRRGP
jgi:hypothetical protein